MRDLYVGIGCFRKAVPLGLSCLGAWLSEVVWVKGDDELSSGADLRVLYGSLGVDTELLESLCDETKLLWEPREGKLLVREGFMRRQDCVDVLSVMLLSIWELPAFSGS
eukprot:3044482-Amphidinium_carterae.1